jgi:hypothetical protein
MRKPQLSLLRNRLGISYAISAVIISAVTIVLVIIASSYAYVLLEQQRGAAEYEVAKESILMFDDALENIAWKHNGAQSARFTISYGQLELIPSSHPAASDLVVKMHVGSNTTSHPAVSTGIIRYSIQNRYVNFWDGYSAYILGDGDLVVTNSTESFGRAMVEQQSGLVNITLGYRVRAMKTSTVIVNNATVNYVDIWIIRLHVPSWSTYIHDFNLKARCLNVSTTSYGPYTIDGPVRVSASLGDESTEAQITDLELGEKVVFNLITANVAVTF